MNGLIEEKIRLIIYTICQGKFDMDQKFNFKKQDHNVLENKITGEFPYILSLWKTYLSLKIH